MYEKFTKYGIFGEVILLLVLCSILLWGKNHEKLNTKAVSNMEEGITNEETQSGTEDENSSEEPKEKDYIKWVDFDVSYNALSDAYNYDVAAYNEGKQLNWVELLAYLGAKYGGDFSRYKKKDMDLLVDQIQLEEKTMEDITASMKYYDYYLEAYTAVLGGFVGEYEIQEVNKENEEEIVWVKKYGLKAFLPIAKNFPYSDYDDFGVARTYGFKRHHLGHDMMGQVGTPIVAVESGYIEAIGWNQYGGWRLGIRSFDQKRYYYYAHLRKDFPYNKELEVGSIVTAGDVVGYLGRTGYSTKENSNNIATAHLHFGMQLIFDESQKEGSNEIWIDCYDLVRFLYKNRCETVKNQETKEWYRIYDMKDPMVDNYVKPNELN